MLDACSPTALIAGFDMYKDCWQNVCSTQEHEGAVPDGPSVCGRAWPRHGHPVARGAAPARARAGRAAGHGSHGTFSTLIVHVCSRHKIL